MATVAELLVKIGADSSGLQKEIAASQRQLKSVFGREGMNLSNSAVTVIEGIAASIGAAGIAAIKCAADIETMTTAFSTLLGSADAGNDMTKQLQDLAVTTPYTTKELGAAARQMLAYGFAAQDIPGLLVNIGNASSALGLGTDGIQRITLALGQMGAKGTVQAEEMRQLAEAGIPAWKALADAMGVSIPEAMAAVEKRTVSSATGINAVLEAMNNRFGGGMEAQSKTIAGSISNIMDAMQLLAGAVGQGINQFTGLSSILSRTGDYIAAFTRIVQSDGIGAAIQQMVPPGVIIGITTLGAVITAIAVPALYALVTSVIAAAAPFLPLIAASAAFAVAAYEIYQNWSVVGPLFSSIFDLISTFASGAYDAVAAAFSAMYDVSVSVWSMIFGVISETVSDIYSVVSSIFEGIVDLGSWLVGGISGVIPGIGEVFRAVFGDDIYNTVVGVFNGLLDVVNQFVSFVSSKLSGVLSFASRVYNAVADVIGAAQATDWGNIKIGIGTPNIAGNIAANLPKSSIAAVTKPDLSGFGTGDAAGKDKEDKKGAREAAQVVKAEADYEIDVEKNKAKIIQALVKDEEAELDRQRKNGLSGIREYWASREKEDTAGIAAIQSYWDQRTELEEKGIQAELDALTKEKDVLQDQIDQTSDPSDSIELRKKMLDLTTQLTLKERELGEVQKKNAELSTEEAVKYIEKYASLLEDTKKSMKNMSTTNIMNGLTGSAKDIYGIKKDKEDQEDAVDNLVKQWKKGTAEIKDEYGVTITDIAGLDKWQAEQYAQIRQNAIDKVTRYYDTAKNIQADIDAAYEAGSMERLRAALSAENAERLNNYNAQKTMMDTYQAAFLASHSTTAQLMADIYAGAFDSMKSGISDIFMGTKSIGDAWSALGQSIRQVIANFIAQWIAGQIMMAIFGNNAGGKQVAQSTAQGAATAAAWAPAAAAVSLATFGANAGPAITGMTLATITAGILAGAGGKAGGGAIYGLGTSTSDSILTWLSNGEYVVQASAVDALGLSALDTINQGQLPAFADGGLVTGAPLDSLSTGYTSVPYTSSDNQYSDKRDQQPQEIHFHLHTLDGPSTEQWLENGGGKKITRYLNKQAGSFALGV